MLEGQHFEPAGRLAQFMRMVDAFERDEMETAVDLLIAQLDERDGDPDMEDDDRGAVLMLARGADVTFDEVLPEPDGLVGDPEDAETDDDDSGIEDERHDPEEDLGVDDRGEPGSWSENGEGGLYAYPDDDHEDDRCAARYAHRDWLRANWCAAISYRGHAPADWRLLATATDLPTLLRGSEL